jgi:hypothetical protein
MSFSVIMAGGIKTKYTLLYGDGHLAGIFVPDIFKSTVTHLISGPLARVDMEDIPWALNFNLIHLPIKDVIQEDSILPTLAVLGVALRAFATLPQRVIRIETFLQPIDDCSWVLYFKANPEKLLTRTLPSLEWRLPGLADQISIVSYFTGGCDLSSADVPPNFMGISVGDSLYVPNMVGALSTFYDMV